MKPKILVTGAKGQLAKAIKNIVATYTKDYEFYFVSKANLDITKAQDVKAFLTKHRFEYCINCAAYTNVAEAEKNPKKAFKVNSEAVMYLADSCKASNTILIHISTDYVFSGETNIPYIETDLPNPINVYGKSKLAGEVYITKNLSSYFIIRTSWLYYQNTNNFMTTMLSLSQKETPLTVVDNQIGSPTYAEDLAKVILKIITLKTNKFGIYHYSNSGQTSWYDFAKTIFSTIKTNPSLSPKKFYNIPSVLNRPLFSVLNTSKIEQTFLFKIPNWKTSLKVALSKMYKF